MTFVVDASAILVWCFDDELPIGLDAVLDRLVDGGMAVPARFSLEVINILNLFEKGGRITSRDATAFVNFVDSLNMKLDSETPSRAWADIRLLAAAEKFTTHDAAYLELTIRKQAELVTKDKDLIAAARRRKTPVLDLRTKAR